MEWNFVNIKEEPIALGGLVHPDENFGEFYRLDASKKDTYSTDNSYLAHHTSGGTVRFVTDADVICIRHKLRHVSAGMHHFTDRGVWGLDVMIGSGINRTYCGEMMQMFAESIDENENEVKLPEGENEVLIYLPLYAGIEWMEIGIPKGASIKAPAKRSMGPIAFYGSSITQGACASRGGTAFHNQICRHFDADCINLGFSGSAFGEQYAAEYLANREMDLFVMDYVFNSRSLEELQNTHYAFYETFRKGHPDTPILMCTHNHCWPTEEYDLQRIATVRATYERAKAAGDENVYFLNGEEYFPMEESEKHLCYVDYLHPNDLGIYYIAKKMTEEIEKILEVK